MQKPRSTNDVGGGKSLEQSLSGESRNHMQHSVQDLLLFDPACVHGFRDSNKGQTICFALTFFIANSISDVLTWEEQQCKYWNTAFSHPRSIPLSFLLHPKEPAQCIWADWGAHEPQCAWRNVQEEARLCSKSTTDIQSNNNAVVSPDCFTIWFSLLQDNFWYDRQFKLNTISRETGVVRHSSFKCHARYYCAHWDLDFNVLYFAPHDTAVFTEAAY